MEAKKIAEPGVTPATVESTEKESTSKTSEDVKPEMESAKSQLEGAEQKTQGVVVDASATPIDLEETETVEVKAGPAETAENNMQVDTAGVAAKEIPTSSEGDQIQADEAGQAAGEIPTSSERDQIQADEAGQAAGEIPTSSERDQIQADEAGQAAGEIPTSSERDQIQADEAGQAAGEIPTSSERDQIQADEAGQAAGEIPTSSERDQIQADEAGQAAGEIPTFSDGDQIQAGEAGEAVGEIPTSSEGDRIQAGEAGKAAGEIPTSSEGDQIQADAADKAAGEIPTSSEREQIQADEAGNADGEVLAYSERDRTQAEEAGKAAGEIPTFSEGDKIQTDEGGRAAGRVPTLSDKIDLTAEDVMADLMEIKQVVKGFDLKGNNDSDAIKPKSKKSKAKLRAERRAEINAERAAKKAANISINLIKPTKGKKAPETTYHGAIAKTPQVSCNWIKAKPWAVGEASTSSEGYQIQTDAASKETRDVSTSTEVDQIQADVAGKAAEEVSISSDENFIGADVVAALMDIKQMAIDIDDITADVKALGLIKKKDSDEKQPKLKKSKAQLRAERRMKQDAQRDAKQAATSSAKPVEPTKGKEAPETTSRGAIAKIPQAKAKGKKKAKKVVVKTEPNLFGLEYKDNTETLRNLPINSEVHPAFVRLGVQLSTREVSGANARSIAMMDALKKMSTDYTLPANTEFSRALDAQLTIAEEFLATLRKSTASEITAVKFYRRQLTQLLSNVSEREAKRILQDQIDRYVREQIFVAGQAISAEVQKKIAPDDIILTYGISSTVEGCLIDAHAAGIPFRCVVCGSCGSDSERGARELKRRLTARGMSVDVVDITSLANIMRTVKKVLLGAVSVMIDGSVQGAVGTAMVALQANMNNVPVLVACETHKFSDKVQSDTFGDNELRNPDDLNAIGNEDWPLKDWRTKPVEILNLAYDLTPPSLVTGLITELGILPCSSAPSVLKFRASTYGI